MINYERDDAFFNTVNRQKQIIEEDLITANNIAHNVYTYAKQISQAEGRKKMLNEQKKAFEKKCVIRKMAVAGAILAVLTTGITVNVVYGNEINTAIVENRELDDAVTILSRNVNMVLNAKGLTNGFYNGGNSVVDYKELNVNSVEEVYIYKYASVLARYGEKSEKEFDKLIKSVSYYDENGKICFYSSFDHFLEVNGFSSEKEFKEKAKKSIIQDYKKGKIKEIPFEGISTLNMAVRGGK